MTDAELILKKALVASNLDSSQWNQIQAGFRNRAFFSSRVASANILQALRDKAAEYAKGETDLSKIRMMMREDLRRLHYEPKEDDKNTIRDLFSQARLDVIVKTNVAQARGYIQHAEGMSPGAFAAFPAQEFTRIRHSRRPRQDWPERWRKAGGKTYGGRMIALKDDPVWTRLSVFGNPFPPFDWGSGMGVLDVSRREALELGLVDEAGIRERVQELRQKPLPDFNANLQATVESAPQDYEKLKELFGKDFGDVVRYEDGVLKWRPEVLQETVLQGKDFSIQLGEPQTGLLDMLRAEPKLAPFADAIEGRQLEVTQDWRDTKRREGGTHLRHFLPTEAHKRKHPHEVAVTAEDMEMLPTMWRSPDRVIRLDTDKFLCELDAFDGSTYMMQIKLEAEGPKLWTFFKTYNPTSKKMNRPNGGTI